MSNQKFEVERRSVTSIGMRTSNRFYESFVKKKEKVLVDKFKIDVQRCAQTVEITFDGIRLCTN